MLSGEGNAGERWKTAIGLFSKKKQHCTCSTPFCTFLCHCFARLQRETSRNFLVARFMEEMSYVFSFSFFFFSCCSFSRWWPLPFLILLPRLQNFHVVLPTKKCLICFLSLALDLCRPFSRWASQATGLPPTFSFSLSFSCSIFQICGHDNESKLNTLDKTDTETTSALNFRLYWLCLCFTRRWWLCDFPPK